MLKIPNISALILLVIFINSCEKEPSVRLPEVKTFNAVDVNGFTAVLGGEVLNEGGSEVSEYGVYWGKHHLPQHWGEKLVLGSGSGEFSGTITGLSENTRYYFVAYAVNEKGRSLGERLNFRTSPSVPEVKTLPVLDITSSSALVRGEVSDNGGAEVSERGIFWGTQSNPEETGEKLIIGKGTGEFSETLAGLENETKYYIKAYAVNKKGMASGEEKSFTALNLPIISTTPPEKVKATSAITGGTVHENGGSTVSSHGIYLSRNPKARKSGDRIVAGEGTGEFALKLENLNPYTKYYYTAYSTNSNGTSFGMEYSFETWAYVSSVRDVDGKNYETRVIGEQKWMTENLVVTRYNNGTGIEFVSEGDEHWITSSQGYYGIYNDSGGKESIYGYLYNWYVIENEHNICPEGWRVPAEEDWQELERHLGMDDYEIEMLGFRGSDHGGMLKDTGTFITQTGFWHSPNTLATNETGFSALPGGYRDEKGHSHLLNFYGNWWSSTKAEDGTAWFRYLSHDSGQIGRHYSSKRNGYSIRCIKE